MDSILNHPLLVLPVSFGLFWICSVLGNLIGRKIQKSGENVSDDFKFVLSVTLTLLGLIIGFTFSMAVNTYNLRKNYEEGEASAISTAYIRASLLPAANAAEVRGLLKSYLDQRILKYKTWDKQQLRQINARTAELQDQLWAAVSAPAIAQPNPVNALVLTGINDVLNSQGYTQAARGNRIPVSAWSFLTLISIFCNGLIGYGARHRSTFVFLILPFALSISFFLIADIDSPRGGLIIVHPQNLENLAESLRTR